jgi:type I restriction enzyme M protein
MMDSLDARGRCGLVVPEGLLFGSTGAHKEIRRQLLESYRVEAVLSLPGGVFQPYSGVKTSALIFARGGATERVLFLHADADGYKLDAQHDQPIEADDLPSLVDAFKNHDTLWRDWQTRDTAAEWGQKWWFADIEAIRGQEFNLTAGRYRPMSQATSVHRDPIELLEELRAIESEILAEMDGLIDVLREEIHV